jgi:propanol-preferring alcohol dehydrogenase
MAHRVIGIDAASKRDLVMESGAEHFIPLPSSSDAADTPSITAQVLALTDGLGAHAVLVLSAANAAYASSVELLRFGGRVVCVGVPEGEALPIASAAPQMIVAKALSIVGVAVGDRKEAIEVLDFAVSAYLHLPSGEVAGCGRGEEAMNC